MLVLITGMSGCGKTTASKQLLEDLNSCSGGGSGSWVLLSQDSFFCGAFVPFDVALKEGSTPIEEPEHVDFEKLKAEVRSKLKQGFSVIVEGHALLSDSELSEQADAIVYIKVDPHTCMNRRIARKGRKSAEINTYKQYFTKFVVPAHERNQLPRINSFPQVHLNNNKTGLDEEASSRSHPILQSTPIQFIKDSGSINDNSKKLYVVDGNKSVRELSDIVLCLIRQLDPK
uniref:Phosphoribulokinase/uridine kinase domain-containing protein n=1 Tax=Aplanochytrium stocchinoi TaxID=215587 RepID=A0A7S3LM37_9STRA|mmetsp:Transcript_15992/g.18978  ORF Transcript_15992/g.18978 Transcript_15992/m.18978 type:complete len:230 (-) Transcript_15992:547-1236(-)